MEQLRLLRGRLDAGAGSSMATPHVAGTAALYLSKNTAETPATVEWALKAAAVNTVTTSQGGAPIKLIYAGPF